MRRIYFLVPNVASAQAIVSELKAASISEQQLYVVANADTPLENLPEASLLERSDLIPALERGVATGGLTGLLAGVVAVTFPPAGLILGGGALIGLTVVGGGFGAWISSMIGIGQPSGKLERFESAIKAGQLLIMVDLSADKVDGIEALIKRHHPEAQLEGLEENASLTGLG